MAEIHEQAERDYMLGAKYQEIADKHGVTINTVKSWKKRYKWERKGVHTNQDKRVHTKTEKGCTQKPAVKAVFTAAENENLTEKETLFCRFFVNNRNATQAAIKAGYSVDSARSIGYENLTKPHIRAEVERLKAIRNQAIMLNEDDIVERYMRIAFADMTDFVDFGIEQIPEVNLITGEQLYDQEGRPRYFKKSFLDFKNANEVDGGLICEIKMGKQGMSVKLEDRQKALDWLKDYFGMNPEHKHKVWFDTQRLEIERKKLDITVAKAGSAENAAALHNEKIATLASMINNPVPVRKLEDFEADDNG